jgi:hypothetical protein
MHPIEACYAPKRGFIAWLLIELDNGQTIEVPTDNQWRVRVMTKKGNWTAGNIAELGWGSAKEVARSGEPISGYETNKQIDKLVPPPHLRKSFNVSKLLKAARVYVTATGLYGLYAMFQIRLD